MLQYSLVVCSGVFLRERDSWPWVIKKGWSCLCLGMSVPVPVQ